ncbi:S9 family peptidase [Lysobacter sp. KIS68-7]|uniref:S9 family peptidase n=1 Tax=Lysobacter sp. KIS68-7 TaxID=2904252 RepID=UPI001E380786|nr:S9 family peptidase [Lysobacter sp. KIS68-7]UHQ21056.1 S9 family peptidase [Lysobacter sp. KIS68-7]
MKLERGASALVLCAGVALSNGAAAQAQVTEADYARAEKMLSMTTAPLVDHAIQRVKWLDDGHFVYLDNDVNGTRLMRMDVATGQAAPAFDHARMAKALSAVVGKQVDAKRIDKTVQGVTLAGDAYDFSVRGTHYLCDIAKPNCKAKPVAKGQDGDGPGNVSPDGKREAFIRNWNLWVRDLATGKETQLTTDGVKDFGYATNNAGWVHDDSAILVWSPDSSKIATFQQDQRKTSSMTVVSTNVGAPKVETWKYPFVGDKDVTMIERVLIDVPTAKMVRLKMAPDQHRSTQCDDVSCFGGWEDVQWAKDGKSIAFVSSARDHTKATLRTADAATGTVKDIFDESAKNWFESGINAINWRYLSDSNEILWWSQRSNWGHLYLYDLSTGKMKQQVTHGDWNVAEVLRIDPATRTVWFTGVNREAGHHPYHQHLYRVNLDDGAEPVLLSPEDAQHDFVLSPDGKRVVDTYSTTTVAPVSVLRDTNDGKVVQEIAKGDLTRLKASGWVAPEPIVVKARDGKTDLYGQMFKPSNFDPNKKYPIINYIYPGPQVGSVRSYGFLPAHGDNQALAELGFIVVAIDGMGTPYRSKAFHDAYAKNVGDNTLPDQITGMKQLAQRYPFIDLTRVGIWGHSGGGNATGTAMFRYPEFFKVGIAESGNHDNRNYEDDWAEKWQGLLVAGKDGKSNYDDQANQNHAANLKGKLLLMHGMMDDNVPSSSTMLVVDALIKANKDFDLLLLPNARHGYGEYSLYVMRKRWDYFVTNLLGASHPDAYSIKPVR